MEVLHVPGEASFQAEASDQNRQSGWCTGPGGRWTKPLTDRKCVRIRTSDCERSSISEHRARSALRSRRRGNGRRQSCDISPVRQGKRHRPLHADRARLRLRRVPWLWRRRWMPWLRRWRWMSRLCWLQRLRLRRLRRRHRLRRRLGHYLGRLRCRRLLPILGRLPFLLNRCNFYLRSGAHRVRARRGPVGVVCHAKHAGGETPRRCRPSPRHWLLLEPMCCRQGFPISTSLVWRIDQWTQVRSLRVGRVA
jgi:hypothetical protein